MAFSLENISGSLWTTLPALLIAFALSAYVFKPVNPQPQASPMTDPLPKTTSADTSAGTSTDGAGEKKAFAVPDELPPPKDEQFTLEDLKKFDGTDASQPIYLSIKGTVFNVSAKRETYGPGGAYNVFSGKDGSRGLGMSSLKPEDAVADWSTLDADDKKVLSDWHAFFTKRYAIMGKVVDLPDAVKDL